MNAAERWPGDNGEATQPHVPDIPVQRMPKQIANVGRVASSSDVDVATELPPWKRPPERKPPPVRNSEIPRPDLSKIRTTNMYVEWPIDAEAQE